MQPASLDVRTGPKRVVTLVACVPDEEQRRRVLEVAAQGGHRVVPAESAAETLELLERLRFDAVVSSGLLPDMSWAELMDRVRGLNCGFVLMETANAAIAAELPVWRPPFALDELESLLGRMAV
jgi:CheY-like chemotaxis protein